MEQTASAENTPKPESPLKKQRGTNRKEHPMKELNRREFLTLSGAAIVALSLAGCGGGSSAPAAPTGKEAELLAAINKVWKEKFDVSQVTHEKLTFNQDAVRAIRCYGRVFEKANETPHQLTTSDLAIVLEEIDGFEAEMLKKYGANSLAGAAGISEPYGENMVTLENEYSCADTAVRTFVAKLLNNSNSFKAEYISIYCPVVQGKTYMTAIVFLNNKP